MRGGGREKREGEEKGKKRTSEFFSVEEEEKNGKFFKKKKLCFFFSFSPVSLEMMIGDSASAALAAATAAVERDGDPACWPEGSRAPALLSAGK